jgi:hypothetical protein
MRLEGVLFPVPWTAKYFMSAKMYDTVVHLQFSLYPVHKQIVVPKDQVASMWPKIIRANYKRYLIVGVQM